MKPQPPCRKCPFRAKFTGDGDYLRPGRRAEIARSVLGGGEFPCHETVDYDVDEEDGLDPYRVPGRDETACVGLDIVMLRAGVSGQMMRIRERIGELDSNALLARSARLRMWEWDDVMRDGDTTEGEPCSVAGVNCEAPAGLLIGGQAVCGTVFLEADDYCPVCGDPVCESCMDDPEHACVDELAEDLDENYYPPQQRSPRAYPYSPAELRSGSYQPTLPTPVMGIKRSAKARPRA